MNILGFQRDDLTLIQNLFKMNLRDRYLGSTLGLAWAVLQPMMFLGMYTFVFGFVFQAKAPGAETTLSYIVWLFTGLVPYMAFSDAILGSASAIIAGSGLVKNVVFKPETLPVATVLMAGIPFAVGMFFITVLLIADGNYPSWHIIGLIPAILIQFAFLLGLGFILSATTVFVRDLVQALPTLTMLLMFFTPIFYSLDMLPYIIQKLTFLNPLYHMTQPYRDVLIKHQLPDVWGLLYLAVLAAILIVWGLKYFRRLKGYFEMKI